VASLDIDAVVLDIDAVILDMDGLMLDTEPVYKYAWQEAAHQFGFLLDDNFYLSLIGRTNASAETALAQHFGIDFPLDAFRKRWADLWHEKADASGIPLKAGAMDLLDHLAKRGLPAAIATSSDQEYAAFSLKAAGLDTRIFARIVTGDQVENGKPAPDIYLETARRLGVSPVRTLAIEDSDAGIMSASEAGMISVMVPDLKPASALAREKAFQVLTSLHEVLTLLVRG
jgi:HAD superfamily hydrolase (TIGR01509 family)